MIGKNLTVGIPREVKPREKRAGLTVEGVRKLSQEGIPVLVEKGAGEGCGFSDQDYRAAGAQIVGRPRDLYAKAEIIKKVKEPLSPEWEFLQREQILICYLHLASPENQKLLEALLKRGVTAIGLETIEKEGRTVALEPMSEIAGTLAAYFSGFIRPTVRVEKGRIVYPPRFLEKLEWLAASYPEIPQNLNPGKNAIFGGGNVGRNAAVTLLKMGGEVDLIEKRAERRQALQREFVAFGPRFRTWGLEENIFPKLAEADVWIGGVHLPGERAPKVLSEIDLGKLTRAKPKLILDIAVDQGGNFPGAHSTTYEDPLYLDSYGNLRFGVTNVPSLCGRGASSAIEKVTLPYTLQMAKDWKKAFHDVPELRSGIQIFRGHLVNEAVARAHQRAYEPLQAVKL